MKNFDHIVWSYIIGMFENWGSPLVYVKLPAEDTMHPPLQRRYGDIMLSDHYVNMLFIEN